MLQRLVNRTLSWLLAGSVVFGVGVGFMMGRKSASSERFLNVDLKEACKPISKNTAALTQREWSP